MNSVLGNRTEKAFPRIKGKLTVFNFSFQVVQHAIIMHPTEDFLFNQSKLLSCWELPFAGETGKAGQMIHVSLGSSNPVSRMDVPTTARTACSVPSTEEEEEQMKHKSQAWFCNIILPEVYTKCYWPHKILNLDCLISIAFYQPTEKLHSFMPFRASAENHKGDTQAQYLTGLFRNPVVMLYTWSYTGFYLDVVEIANPFQLCIFVKCGIISQLESLIFSIPPYFFQSPNVKRHAILNKYAILCSNDHLKAGGEYTQYLKQK